MVRIFLATIFLFVLAGCSTIQVKNSYNPKTDFSRLKTYAWLNEKDQPGENVRINNDLVKSIIRSSAEETLGAKGFTRTERDKADFLVTWFGAIEQEIQTESINHFYAPYGYGSLYRDPAVNPGQGVVNVHEFEKGTLIFDLLDPSTKKVIWRGTGSDQVVRGRPEGEVKRNLQRAVEQILAGFPPK